KSVVMSPFTLLDSTSRQPGVPWIAFVLLIFWSMIEATIFTFTLRPTMAELLADLTGYTVNPLILVVILWFFLFIIIGGSFACIQVLNEAIKSRSFGQIGAMVGVEITVALFEVLFLYRELIDAITPWLAQQGIELGVVGTLGLAFLGWTVVRGMAWFLFCRSGRWTRCSTARRSSRPARPTRSREVGRDPTRRGTGRSARRGVVFALGTGRAAPLDAGDRHGYQWLVPAEPQLQRGDRVRGALHLRPSERHGRAADEHRDLCRRAGRRAARPGQGVPPDPGPVGEDAGADRGRPASLVPARRPDHRFQRILPACRPPRQAQQSRPG